MAATTGSHRRTSAAASGDMNGVWRLRCRALEEKLTDVTAALRASEAERRELSLDYRHSLALLWQANARMPRSGKR